MSNRSTPSTRSPRRLVRRILPLYHHASEPTVGPRHQTPWGRGNPPESAHDLRTRSRPLVEARGTRARTWPPTPSCAPTTPPAIRSSTRSCSSDVAGQTLKTSGQYAWHSGRARTEPTTVQGSSSPTVIGRRCLHRGDVDPHRLSGRREPSLSYMPWFHPVGDAGYAFCDNCGSSLCWKSNVTPKACRSAPGRGIHRQDSER
jgi:hypothetical protein